MEEARNRVYRLIDELKKIAPTIVDGKSSVPKIDTEMPDVEAASSPKVVPQFRPIMDKSKNVQQHQEH